MTPTTESAIAAYRQAHQQMYGDPPRDLRAVNDVILLHGLALTAAELLLLADQLRAEHARTTAPPPPVLRRFLDWLNH